jgi:hypothetical protein
MIVPLQIRIGMLIEFTYTNHRGITALRRAVVVEFVFGSSPWHPDAQMIMMGFDIEKKELREFATKDMLAVRRLEHL